MSMDFKGPFSVKGFRGEIGYFCAILVPLYFPFISEANIHTPFFEPDELFSACIAEQFRPFADWTAPGRCACRKR